MILSTEYFIAKEKIQKNIISIPIQSQHLHFFGTEVFGDNFPENGQLYDSIKLIQILNDEYFNEAGIENIEQYSLILFKTTNPSAELYLSFIFNYEKLKNKELGFVLTNKYRFDVVENIKLNYINSVRGSYYVFDSNFNYVDTVDVVTGLEMMLSSKYFVFKKENETTPEVYIYNKAGRKIDWVQLFLKNINSPHIESVFFYNFVLGFSSDIITDFFKDSQKNQNILDLLEIEYVDSNTQWAYYFQDNCSRKNLSLPTIIREMEASKINKNVINSLILFVIFDQRANKKNIVNIDLFEKAVS